jgi:hypothetical protein
MLTSRELKPPIESRAQGVEARCSLGGRPGERIRARRADRNVMQRVRSPRKPQMSTMRLQHDLRPSALRSVHA